MAVEAQARLEAEGIARPQAGRLDLLGGEQRAGELDRVVHRVTANALEEKARALGEITELSEDPETGELTIRVKL